MWQVEGWQILSLTVSEMLMVFYGNSRMQGQLHSCRALFSSPFPMSSVWTVSSHWDECCGRNTFPTKAVIHSVSLHHFQSSQQKLSPPPPIHPSKVPSPLLSEARLWAKTFLSSLSPISTCRLGAGELNLHKETAVWAEPWWKRETSSEEAPAQ